MSKTLSLIRVAVVLTALVGVVSAVSAASTVKGKMVELRKTADNFIVMYDSSSSTGERYADTDMKEIEAEKTILKEKVMTLPELDWNAGIYTFTPGWSFGYFKPLLSMRTYDKNEFAQAVETLPGKPSGFTPLQGGLVGLGKELASLQGKTVVFLFTDGQFSSQGGFPSPGQIAKDIAANNDVCFKVIATSEDKAQYQAIKNIASVNDCSSVIPFEDLLGHPDWLTDILFKVVEIGTVAEKSDSEEKVIKGETFEHVLFEFDKSNITEQGAKALLELSIFMQMNPETRAVLAGYTDSIGTKEYNIELSKKRAESARSYLTEHGLITPERITLSWFGKDDPEASNETEAGRMKNRRVTAVIVNK